MKKLNLSQFDYELADEFIAQTPAEHRDKSRLIIAGDKLEHRIFSDIVEYLKEGDVLVLNETKVIPAKLIGNKITGAAAEIILMVRDNERVFDCRIKTHRPKIGEEFIFSDLKCRIIRQNEDFFSVEFDKPLTDRMIKKKGILPLPPYIKKEIKDYSRYQTIFAKKEGAVAAPTAGLHFTGKLLDELRSKGVKTAKICLHVGFGTFLPIREEDITKHEMEREYYEIEPIDAQIINNCKGRLICVGTTCLRALESASEKDGKIKSGSGYTSLFIYPGYEFKSKTKAMITNFHLPNSTLLLMVSAFAGKKRIFSAYKSAIKHNYRFFSFGDAMVLFKE
ncbi:tRNA preQ1(34) S-adenosylmethionine ribosyltransferase-isomerase QueA [Candidatus Woesearchaeota archaeon]|nr:tRNA preQ1(34) S-adenosylmethionine ribosyltransferase-isomerase QueA [Candidatus Woesearchaeota archaeon]